MLESIVKAAENFCIHQLGSKAQVQDATTIKGGALIAYIDVETETKERFRVFLAAQKPFVQRVAEIFLEETSSDDATIMDMALECTNMIVGSAKVIAAEKGLVFTIDTPRFESVDTVTEEFEEAKTLLCDGNALLIAIREITN